MSALTKNLKLSLALLTGMVCAIAVSHHSMADTADLDETLEKLMKSLTLIQKIGENLGFDNHGPVPLASDRYLRFRDDKRPDKTILSVLHLNRDLFIAKRDILAFPGSARFGVTAADPFLGGALVHIVADKVDPPAQPRTTLGSPKENPFNIPDISFVQDILDRKTAPAQTASDKTAPSGKPKQKDTQDWIVRLDSEGQEIHRFPFDPPQKSVINNLVARPGGGLLVTAFTAASKKEGKRLSNPPWVGLYDRDGRLEKDLSFFFQTAGTVFETVTAANGDMFLAMDELYEDHSAISLLALQADGTKKWRRFFENDFESLSGKGLLLLPDGGMAMTAEVKNRDAQMPKRVDLLRLDAEGNILWSNGIYRNVGGLHGSAPTEMNGNIGFFYRPLFKPDQSAIALYTASDGRFISEHRIDKSIPAMKFRLFPRPEGGVILLGEKKLDGSTEHSAMAYEFDGNGAAVAQYPF